jgi:hypothetical protein
MSISPLLYILISTATGTPKRRRKPERITTTEVSNNLILPSLTSIKLQNRKQCPDRTGQR